MARCEFTIGPGRDGQTVVGFCLGAYKDGVTSVASPEGCPHISGLAVRYAELLQDFLRSRSRLPAWDKRLNCGTVPSLYCYRCCPMDTCSSRAAGPPSC